ncbi:leucine-rich repeat-containing protein 15-like [Saccostrea cucullata]|uniref:leucine-rich repeat-containing protein 15-like n=1 Tax=Saccostrea cuccullata TaxID=36930 RepID=UPI002ED536C6
MSVEKIVYTIYHKWNKRNLLISKICFRWLEYNEITIIQTNIFNGLSNLQELSLSRNKISIIQSNAFNGLPNLQSLYIYNNSITVLDKDIFLGILKLEKLFAQSKNLLLERWSEPTCSSPNNLTGVLLQDVSPEDMICDVTTATTPSKKISGKMNSH